MLKSKISCLVLAVIISGLASAASATDMTKTDIEVELIGANETDKDSAAVISALQKLLSGLAHRDLTIIGSCLSDDVTTLDQTKKYVYGKQAVLDHVKKNVVGTDSQPPVKSIKVYNPFVHVKGDTAMVSFRATKDLADKNSTTMESWCSEVFERKNGEWLVLQLKTDWKVAKANTNTNGNGNGKANTDAHSKADAK